MMRTRENLSDRLRMQSIALKIKLKLQRQVLFGHFPEAIAN